MAPVRGIRVGLTFDTGYRNLVVTGSRPAFCLVSGAHERGFPWGDPAAASDLLLVVGDGDRMRRFVAGGAALAGLEHEVAGGRYRYRGPVHELPPGVWRVALSDLDGDPGGLGLRAAELEIELALEVTPLAGGAIHVPFGEVAARVRADLGVDPAREVFGDEDAILGMDIDVAAVRVTSGRIAITGADLEPVAVDCAGARGEAEDGDYVGMRRPPVRYHYLCGVYPDGSAVDGALAIRTDVLDPGGGGLVDDTVAHLASSLLRAAANCGRTWAGDRASPADLTPLAPLHVVEPVLKLAWDHLDTGVFERKIVRLGDGAGGASWGCEEDMYLKQAYGPRSTTQEIAEVHVVRDADSLAALDRVLDATGFDDLVRERARALGVDLGRLAIALKPNFMFMYSLEDPSTYTDPALVLRVVDRLRGLGCDNIAIVEAQSAYGNYFEGRDVRSVADYIGLATDDPRFRVVDLTEEQVPFDYGHRLGAHVVGPTWRDAELRISFCKNKTHTWSFYTLGIKNTYGALPAQNKLREYHDKREIYYPTIDALRHFPVHYSLIDASLSSDGQFGIFANRHPKPTETIIGGRDLIATDWVGAAKMGLDPMISRYMREATFAFGKPEIVWRGDRDHYAPWDNVERAMTEFWDHAEEHYDFADLIFRILNDMDGRFPRRKQRWYVRVLRFLFGWVRRLIFRKVRPALPPAHTPKEHARRAAKDAERPAGEDAGEEKP